MRILEVGLTDLLKRNYPDEVDFVSTRVRWKEANNYSRNEHLWRSIKKNFQAALLSLKEKFSQRNYDVVVVRALGPTMNPRYGPDVWFQQAMGMALRSFIKIHCGKKGTRLVVLDITDHMTIHPRDKYFLKRADLYFKRELALNKYQSLEAILPFYHDVGRCVYEDWYQEYLQKLRPLPLGAPQAGTQISTNFSLKKWDLFYSGGDRKVWMRQALSEWLRVCEEAGLKVYFPQERIPKEEFLNAITQSWVTISPSGTGWDCYRHYEIPWQGSIPMLTTPGIFRYAPTLHNESCFILDPQNFSIDWMVSLFRDKEHLRKMTIQAQEHFLQYHSEEAIGRYIRQEIEKLF